MIRAPATFDAVRAPPGRLRVLARVAAIPALCLVGCVRGIDTEYAAVRGDSINGVSAFVQLLRDGGRPTTARQRLPATIAPECRTVVIFDDSFTRLEPAALETVDRLLAATGEHTVLLVLRDSDAAIPYLRAVIDDDVADDVRDEARRQLARHETFLAAMTAEPREATRPFPDGLVPVVRETATGPLEVRARTASGTTARIAAAWELRRRLESGPGTRVLWSAGGEPLLVRRTRGGGDLLVLASATPLLNGGLVDGGNRALAEELAALLPEAGRVLVARAPRPGGGGGDGDDEGAGDEPSPWRLLAVQPLPWVAIHALAAIGLFCWWRSPIFGRPRREDPSRVQDFGHHVDALAGLFTGAAADGDTFATERLRHWTKDAPRRAGGRDGRPLA